MLLAHSADFRIDNILWTYALSFLPQIFNIGRQMLLAQIITLLARIDDTSSYWSGYKIEII